MPHEHHVMVDLETLGTNADAPIGAIGAVLFTFDDGVVDRFYQRVDFQSCFNLGCHANADTIGWWMRQSDAARTEMFDPAERMEVRAALLQFKHWIDTAGCVFDPVSTQLGGVWGNGAAFDNSILQFYAKKFLGEPLWKYSLDRCYRNEKATARELGIEWQRPEDLGDGYHQAMKDAGWQALDLIAMRKAWQARTAPVVMGAEE